MRQIFRRSGKLVVGIGICLALTTATMAADWPQFRGPGGEGIAKDKGLPTTWSDSENIVWKTKMPGAGASSPIVLNGKVYLTAYSGYGMGVDNAGSLDDLMLHVLCVDGKGGKILWDKQVKPAGGEKKKIRDHGYAGPTPATDGKALYVFFGKAGVFKFDLNGKQLWQADVGTGTHGWGCGTSPVLTKKTVIINASVESGSVIGLDKNSGKEVWRQKGIKDSWTTPHLVDLPGGKQELVVSSQTQIKAYDPDTGKPLWNCKGVQDYVCPSISSKDGVVYVIGARNSQAYAVRAGGRGDVTKSHTVWFKGVGANVCSPVAYGEYLYWTSDRNGMKSYCLRLSDGKMMYQEKCPSQPYASTVIADGKQYVVTRRGGTIVLDAKPEYKLLARNKLSDKGQFNATPAIADGKIYLRSDTTLYCIGK